MSIRILQLFVLILRIYCVVQISRFVLDWVIVPKFQVLRQAWANRPRKPRRNIRRTDEDISEYPAAA